MTHLMGRNGLLGRRGFKRDSLGNALRIGQAPPKVPLGTREAISTHRRPCSFARSVVSQTIANYSQLQRGVNSVQLWPFSKGTDWMPSAEVGLAL